MFSTWLKALLDKHGLKPSQAALYIGVSDSAVSKWLKGRYNPEPAQCRKIAAYFRDVSLEEVLRAAGHYESQVDALSPQPPSLHPMLLRAVLSLDWEAQGALGRSLSEVQRSLDSSREEARKLADEIRSASE